MSLRALSEPGSRRRRSRQVETARNPAGDALISDLRRSVY